MSSVLGRERICTDKLLLCSSKQFFAFFLKTSLSYIPLCLNFTQSAVVCTLSATLSLEDVWQEAHKIMGNSSLARNLYE